MKISVVYHSVSGNTAKVADYIVKGIEKVEGVEAKAFSIDEADAEFLMESQAVLVGTPTYNGTLSGVMKMWLEKAGGQYKFAGKIGGAFATERYVHGGAEVAIQSVLTHLLVAGMLVYSSGGSEGHPVIHLGPVAIASELEKYEETFNIYGERMAKKTKEIFG